MSILRRSELATFLRSRRLRISPHDAGLWSTGGTRRRTNGLRREEVSVLAGISLPWYTALEQGRDINVSEQILESLARTLRLDKDERNHLFSLASPRRMATKSTSDKEFVSNSIQFLLDQMQLCPAYVTDEKMNVLTWNRLASLVFGSFETEENNERNMLRRMFLLPSYRTLFIDWEKLAQSLLGHFRVMYTKNIEDPWYQEFIAELAGGSPDFAAWWDSYEVQCKNQYPRIIEHPQVGMLNLSTNHFPLQDNQCQYLYVFTPDPTDGSIERLANLARTAK